jgi:hypothetical protein
MRRALLIALAVSLAGNLLLARSGSLANGGLFAGKELLAIGFIALMAGVAFLAAVRQARPALGVAAIGFVVSSLGFSLLVLLGPLAFCVAFMPNASCM